MNWEDSARSRLPRFLDDRLDLAPPWERFPEYERGTIGWRMGAGEDWMCMWYVFLDQLGRSREDRIAYLRRHPPAPCNWANVVRDVLFPDEPEEVDEPVSLVQRARFLSEGLIASDAAYPVWLQRQQDITWPWTYSETPELAARYRTRDLWFWSRQVSAQAGQPGWTVPDAPPAWAACAHALAARNVSDPEPSQGLLTLARMLASGKVTPPWNLNVALSSFADTFEAGMGYSDAFRLWVISAFDDTEHRDEVIGPAPPGWKDWVDEHCAVEWFDDDESTAEDRS